MDGNSTQVTRDASAEAAVGRQPVLGPATGAAAAAAIGAIHTEVQSALAARNWHGVVVAVDALSEFNQPTNLASDRLFDLRCSKVEGLHKIGRPKAARAYLEELDNIYGSDWRLRRLAALLQFYRAELTDCMASIDDALISLPPGKDKSGDFYELVQLRTEAMIRAGMKREARDFMMTALRRKDVLSYEELMLLRATIETPQDLREFHTFLVPYFSFKGHRARHALFHYAIAARDAGDMKRAIYAARQRFLTGVQLVEWGAKKKVVSESWSGEARIALRDLKEDTIAAGVEFFLVSGTLLGCVREHDVLGHDKDIDVGVLPDTDLEALSASIDRSGRFVVKPFQVENLLRLQHANGVSIDIFRHWREDGKMFHRGNKTHWWNTDFNLQRTRFLDDDYLIPTQPERYLAENYGASWKTPEPNFETFVDTPNMVVEDQDHVMLYYYIKLFDYYFEAKPAQMARVWKALRTLTAVDRRVNLTMQTIRKAYLENVPK